MMIDQTDSDDPAGPWPDMIGAILMRPDVVKQIETHIQAYIGKYEVKPDEGKLQCTVRFNRTNNGEWGAIVTGRDAWGITHIISRVSIDDDEITTCLEARYQKMKGSRVWPESTKRS